MCKVVEYKLVEGYENYAVSSDGKVWSLDYRHTGKMKELKPATDKDGYLRVGLNKDGKQKTCKVHQIVLNTFVPKPSPELEVMHLDSDPTNNRLENLKWGTHKENLNDIHRKALLTNHPAKSTPVVCLETGEVYPSTHEAERQTGVNHSSISECLNGKRKTAGGYHWAKFVEGDNPIYE